MLYFLAELRHIWGPFRLFEYITFRAGAAAFTAFLIVVLLGPWTARKLRAMRAQAASRYEGILPPEMIDREKEKTPCMGGLLLIGGVIVSALLWMNLSGMLSWLFIISTFEFMLVGFYDDYKKVLYYKAISNSYVKFNEIDKKYKEDNEIETTAIIFNKIFMKG